MQVVRLFNASRLGCVPALSRCTPQSLRTVLGGPLEKCSHHCARERCQHTRGKQITPNAALHELSAVQQSQIDQFLDIMLDENTRMNLTAIRDKAEAVDRHIMDALAILPVIEHYAEDIEALKIIDVGSGAGVPGLVFAIARPHWKVTLLDSLKKRCTYLENTVKALGVSNVDVLWSRAEDAGQDRTTREAFDVVVARAVADMRILSEYCMPLARVGGVFVAAKGSAVQAEVEASVHAVEVLGGQLTAVQRVDSFGPDGQRTAVVVRKVKPTPKQYPRRAGTPKKKPIGES